MQNDNRVIDSNRNQYNFKRHMSNAITLCELIWTNKIQLYYNTGQQQQTYRTINFFMNFQGFHKRSFYKQRHTLGHGVYSVVLLDIFVYKYFKSNSCGKKIIFYCRVQCTSMRTTFILSVETKHKILKILHPSTCQKFVNLSSTTRIKPNLKCLCVWTKIYLLLLL